MSGQDALDQAFHATPQERAVLRSGRIPASVLRRLRVVSRSSLWNGRPPLILFIMLSGLALGLLVSPVRTGLVLALSVLLAVPVVLVLWMTLREWRHERKVFATRPPLRVLEGSVKTIRTWEYGYGDCYHLWAALEFVGQSDKPVCLFGNLGSRTISGWARVFLATVPSRKRGLAPYYETPIAIDIREDTTFVEREPRKPRPEDPLRVKVPAD